MNKFYRLVWNAAKNRWVVAPEKAKARGPWGCAAVVAAAALASAPGAQAAPAATALPQGGQVAAGQASIATTGSAMTITQTTNQAVLNWQSFNIGSGASVKIVQPSSSSSQMERITGSSGSEIYGQLSSNGRVYLVNPNGIMFAPGSQVDVGAMVGSTLGISDSDFMAGRDNFIANAHAAGITTQGSIFANQNIVFHGGAINNSGVLKASSLVSKGGDIWLDGDSVDQTGTVSADGQTGGGTVNITARTVMQQGSVTADSAAGAGGSVTVTASENYLDTQSAVTSASGATDGGSVTVNAMNGNLFSSGTTKAAGSNGQGGQVALLGKTIDLVAAKIDASGGTGGGTVLVGGDAHGAGSTPTATTTMISPDTTIDVSAKNSGNGGKSVVWSNTKTVYAGTINAAGAAGGTGGWVEVSSKGDLTYAGMVSHASSLLLDPKNITIDSATGVQPLFYLIDPRAGIIDATSQMSDNFGSTTYVLSVSGNIVVNAQYDSAVASLSGASYLYNGRTGALISTLTGSQAGDQVGNYGITEVGHGNYVVGSDYWANGGATYAGALTWGSGTLGVSGAVSASNSLVGSSQNDYVGYVQTFANGNYASLASSWTNGSVVSAGAVTWGNGATGTSGVVSAANSLVGTHESDGVGMSGVDQLSNGNYLVRSQQWNNSAGAVTFVSGASPLVGAVSSTNSLVGTHNNDNVGNYGITELTNGNYVVKSGQWNNGMGAATWGSGTTGVTGAVSSANSVVGSTANDGVGAEVLALSNGNYVTYAYNWVNGDVGAGNAGAVTWGNGATGTSGVVSASNSLVGTHNGDQIGFEVYAVGNGNYVVNSPHWSDGMSIQLGAVTWGNGATGATIGAATASNSLVGSRQYDQVGTSWGGITVLTNGNYVVQSSNWTDDSYNSAVGAVTWGDGNAGVIGTISASNSLVGSTMRDHIGGVGWNVSNGITALSNGNYLVSSPGWSNNTGAVTWGNGATGTTGVVSAANSLVGSSAGDMVGYGNIVQLSNGNYVVKSQYWGATYSAVTWGNGATGTSGVISAANSLVGTSAGEGAYMQVTPLSNGNYVISDHRYSNGAATNAGSVTWGSGTSGVTGTISAANSLVGDQANENVSLGATLTNGNYVVVSDWGNGTATNLGSVTWASGTTGKTGVVSDANSLVGSQQDDKVGYNISALSNGNYVVESEYWANGAATNAGAVTWASGTSAITGVVSAANSLVGTKTDDHVGDYGVMELANGNYAVLSSQWTNGSITNAGAISFGSGKSGVTGAVSAANSILGAHGCDVYCGQVTENTANGSVILQVSGDTPSIAIAPQSLTFAQQPSQSLTLQPSFLTNTLGQGTAVTLQANNDITVNSDINVSAGGNGGALTLRAGRSININANITTDNGNFTAVSGDPEAISAYTDAGWAAIVMGNGGSINTGTGTKTLTGNTGAATTNITISTTKTPDIATLIHQFNSMMMAMYGVQVMPVYPVAAPAPVVMVYAAPALAPTVSSSASGGESSSQSQPEGGMDISSPRGLAIQQDSAPSEGTEGGKKSDQKTSGGNSASQHHKISEHTSVVGLGMRGPL